jgi:MinD superfamily P-loop ATPase
VSAVRVGIFPALHPAAWTGQRLPRFRSPGSQHCARCVPLARFSASACSSPAHPASCDGCMVCARAGAQAIDVVLDNALQVASGRGLL